MSGKTFILGAGITGLAAGSVSGIPIFEAGEIPGGLCLSYYAAREKNSPDSGRYRFERGGGHWIFGADRRIVDFISEHTGVKSYIRRSSVYFSKNDAYIPYPIQNNLRFLKSGAAEKALKEISHKTRAASAATMAGWLERNFGRTLCKLFFFPFHRSYTAGLYKRIAPQDSYKTPVNRSLAIRGSKKNTPAVGYNASFIYPVDGLDKLVEGLSKRCRISYRKRVIRIDTRDKRLFFSDGDTRRYDRLASTIPLNQMVDIAGIRTGQKDPYTSVKVLNIGAIRGKRCPDEHWLYIPDASTGFFRVGFYSNVDGSFLPKPSRAGKEKVSIYVERAYPGGERPSSDESANFSVSAIKKLTEWGYIDGVDVRDDTWIDVAYTWRWPASKWRELAISKLRGYNIYQIGRYGQWRFQGIADSIREGLDWAGNKGLCHE